MQSLMQVWQTKLNPGLYKKDPASSELGTRIVIEGLSLISDSGFDKFTFKKLAERLHTTESSVYRYFDNKHRFLIYLVSHYWLWQEYHLIFRLQNIDSIEERLNRAIDTLCSVHQLNWPFEHLNRAEMYKIMIDTSIRTYYSDEVDEENKAGFFSDYKRLHNRIVHLITEYAPNYPYPKALVSCCMENIQVQIYYRHHLPSLTEINDDTNSMFDFIKQIIFQTLKPYTR